MSDPDYKYMLKELLAVIHGDGGHYCEEHGIEKCWEHATAEVYFRQAQLDDERNENAILKDRITELEGRSLEETLLGDAERKQ